MAVPPPKLAQPLPERPANHKKQSSRSILFKALVSPVKGKPTDARQINSHDVVERSNAASHLKSREQDRGRVLGERTHNMQSPPRTRSCHASSQSIRLQKSASTSRTGSPEKRASRQPRDIKEKENATPRASTENIGHLQSMIAAPLSKAAHERPRSPGQQQTSRAGDHPIQRKTSDSSAEIMSPKKSLSIMKRGARVMAAVAAIQGKSVPITPAPEEAAVSPAEIEARFETMLSNRNVAPAMRDKMRNLTLRMKADLVKQEQDVQGSTSGSRTSIEEEAIGEDGTSNDDQTSTKRSRPRSRAFTFSRSERHADGSPSKKQRGRSRSRPAPIDTTGDASDAARTAPSTPRRGSARGSRTENPADFITYLKTEQDPTKVEVGRLHKLRILLRNETVAWVDNFVALDGLTQITGLLDRIMAVEWREDHEDQLLHETLLCLKGLCTTESALAELSKYADTLFPALLAMLFDEEKKGPSEYSTRAVILNVLFAYLSAHTADSANLESRARVVLAYLSTPSKSNEAHPLDFVMDMRVSRPYKHWCREITNVTREVFWIFLHQLNVIPVPKAVTGELGHDGGVPTTYTSRHFPGVRPPVPAAPYIGGVEWDATTYITGHLDLLNGLIASLPSREARNALRQELHASGFEKTMGATLRTCKEKFYAGVHDGLRAWVAAATEDGWPTLFVCEGPTLEEQAKSARSSPKKGTKAQPPPKLDEIKLDIPKLDLNLGYLIHNDNETNGWLDA